MKNILLIGDQIVDKYIIGACERISPEAPVPIVDVENVRFLPGGASNVEENLKALGVKVDAWYGDKAPSIKTRIVSGDKQILRIDEDNPEKVKPPKDLEERIKKADLVMLCDYDQGVVNEEVLFEVNDLAQEHGKKILVDPYRSKYKYGNVNLIKPNRKELESVVGVRVDDETLFAAGRNYLDISRAENLIVTLGADGMVLFDHDNYWNKPFICKPHAPKQVVDVTGAGDTVFAVLGFIWVHEHFSKSTSLIYATKAASIAVTKFGCYTVKKDEIFDGQKNHSFH